uniref:DUF538 domain-containing protein n=1 Tax=Kalanchoe fedtschenkoi TaxID=63787 RepID=A0A7N0VG30_KALFE
MSAQLVETHREGAEVYTGEDLCRQKSIELLEELHFPKGLLPLNDFIEVGYNRAKGFVWLTQKKSKEHTFKKIGKKVSYATEVTAFVEDRRMKKLTGVKSKELLIWVTISDIYIEDPSSGKISFANSTTGIVKTFPVSAFELEEAEKK